MKYLIHITLFLSAFVNAEPYTPKDSDIIAVSSKKVKNDYTKEQLNKLFSESQYVGNTESNQGILKRYLEHKVTQSDDPDIHYFYARLLQREHQFDEAINILNKVTEQAPQHINAILLKANLLMVKGKFDDALSECLSLFGLVSIETISTCSLDVKSQNGELKQSYEGLKKIANSSSMSLNTRHVLAEMAYRLDNTEQTLSYLSDVDLKTAPVSLVVLWADAQLAQKNSSAVLSTLTVLTPENTNLEDAILLRLAQAEKIENESTKWQKQMKKRVMLRELRQDTYHASDLAWYYLTINKNMTKAKYWARINWQQAKLQSDKRLLELTGLIN